MQETTPAFDSSVGYSFSVAGLLFPYHLGVAEELKREGLIVAGTPLAVADFYLLGMRAGSKRKPYISPVRRGRRGEPWLLLSPA